VKRSEPDGVRPAISKAVVGISTKQSGGEMSVSAARLENQNVCLAFRQHRIPRRILRHRSGLWKAFSNLEPFFVLPKAK
jgi:hypothetical protein